MTMVAQVLRGAPRAAAIRQTLRDRIVEFCRQGRSAPVLAALQVGRHPSCEAYADVQHRAAEQVGIIYRSVQLEESVSESALIDEIRRLNEDRAVHGVLMHLPLPERMERRHVHGAIALEKDVEGVHPMSLGLCMTGRAPVVSPIALAVVELLEQAGVVFEGREVVIVGHSDLIGKPLALLLLERMATVTVCHRGTSDRGALAEHVGRAEVVVSAVGYPGLIRGAWIREGAVVIDIGTTMVGDRVIGDVEFEAAAQRASHITPVPGGVGPLTVAFLMHNVVQNYVRQQGVTP